MQFNITPMVRNLLFLNVGVYIIGAILKVNLNEIFGLRYIHSPEFAPYQIITHMFMHANVGHLLSNMFALYMFGPMLENIWGANRFLIFYLVCGLGAALLYSGVTYYEVSSLEKATLAFLSSPSADAFLLYIKDFAPEHYDNALPIINAFSNSPNNPELISETTGFAKEFFEARVNMPMVGASGAVFGILMGYGMMFPNTVLMLLFPPIPMKAKYFVGIYGLIELFTGIHRIPGDNVAHFAHIGGMIFGFILIKIWNNRRNTFY